MKRLVIILPIVALTSVLLLHMNANRMKRFSAEVQSQLKKRETSTIKYDDCITETIRCPPSSQEAFLKKGGRLPKDVDVSEIDVQIDKYRTSLDSTVQSLNSMDAHSFLHAEYRRYRKLIYYNTTSPIKTYYYFKIMEACYINDEKLNQSSRARLARLCL